ncbi:MAG: septum formation initiator family protein [Candidatus Krumholzibacteriia bacterium]
MRYWQSGGTKPRKKRKPAPGARRSITSGGSLRHYPFLRSFYQHQAVISVGLQRFLFFLVIASILYAFVLGDAGVIRVLTLRHEKAGLEESLTMLMNDTERLEKEIERLGDDPFMMEKLGRERYGYIHPGDRVFKIVRPPDPR